MYLQLHFKASEIVFILEYIVYFGLFNAIYKHCWVEKEFLV